MLLMWKVEFIIILKWAGKQDWPHTQVLFVRWSHLSLYSKEQGDKHGRIKSFLPQHRAYHYTRMSRATSLVAPASLSCDGVVFVNILKWAGWKVWQHYLAVLLIRLYLSLYSNEQGNKSEGIIGLSCHEILLSHSCWEFVRVTMLIRA